MRALVLNRTLKASPAPSNTQLLTDVVITALREESVEVEVVRVVDGHIPPGVDTDLGGGDEWPQVHEVLMGADILIIAAPMWMGQPSSVSKLVIERMDAMITETEDDGTDAAHNKVAGVVVTGNEDGAHHVITEVAGALIDIGFTIPGQAWTYWNRGPGPGLSYTDTDEGHEWSHKSGRTMAANLLAAATALKAHPLPPAA